MRNNRNPWIIVLIIFYIFLVFVDIGLNLFSLIPGIGDIFETISELIIETLSGLLMIILAFFGWRK